MHTAPGLANGVALFNAMKYGPIAKSSLSRCNLPIFGARTGCNKICVNCSITHCPDYVIQMSAFNSTAIETCLNFRT